MSTEMEGFKISIFLFSLFITANSQITNQSLLDQQRLFQEIERYGLNHSDPSQNSIYPQLTNFTDATYGFGQGSNSDATRLQNSSFPQPHGVNNTERFLNHTILNMAKGVCIKEVP